MENYKIIKRISDGAFGTVYQAKNMKAQKNNQLASIVAIKQLYSSSQNLKRQLQILKNLAQNEHIITIYQTFTQNFMTSIVMQRGKYDLSHWMTTITYPICEKWIKNIAFQILKGVLFIHERGIIHRDLKPTNLVLKDNGVICLCDFGSAIQCTKGQEYQIEGFTRWYKAPEMLFGYRRYKYEVDIWSVGCILMQIATGEPLFNGKSQIQQLALMAHTLGDPSIQNWPSVVHMPDYNKINFKNIKPKTMQQISEERWISLGLCEFIFKMIRYEGRSTAKELLKDPYLSDTQFQIKDQFKESQFYHEKKHVLEMFKKNQNV